MEERDQKKITEKEIHELYEKLHINLNNLPKYQTFDEFCRHLSFEEENITSFQLQSKTEVL